MKHLTHLFCLVFVLVGFGQNPSEIYLYNISANTQSLTINNPKNISKSKGYNSQPSFLDDRYIVFSSERKGQTDIAKYDTRYGSKLWVNFTEGSEYTPLKIPNKNAVSAVRLDKDGKQLLYSYNLRNGDSKVLIDNLKVAYYTWYDKNTIVSAVIEEDGLNLYTTFVSEGKNRKYATKVGRSFHKIPNSNLVSFISKENEKQWQIKSLNPSTGTIKTIANTIENVEDICWLNGNTIISSKGNAIYKLTLKKDNDWQKVTTIENATGISRLLASEDASKLLVVISSNSEEVTTKNDTPKDNNTTQTEKEQEEVETIVQRNLDAYNAKNIDAFMADYGDDIKIYNFPNTLRTEGKDAMRKGYTDWFNRAKGLKANIVKRIIIGNKVIDEEQVTANGRTFSAVAIYEVENGKIVKVTFIQ